MARAHELLGGRWTLLIVREILCGGRRFNDIRRGIPRVSRTVLSERLQALVLARVITRTEGAHGPEYAATEAGQELAGVVGALGTWGQRWLARGYAATGPVRGAAARAFRGALRHPRSSKALHAAQEDRGIAMPA